MTALALALSLSLAADAPNPFLAEAKALYAALDFERCLERLDQAAKQWTSTPRELFEIEVFTGLTHLNLGQTARAREHFRVAQRIDPAGALPPYSSPKAVDLWLDVKRSLAPKPPPFPDSDLPDDAPRRAELQPQLPASPLAPAPPIAWRRHAAPAALSLLAAAGLAVGVGLGVRAKQLEGQANTAAFEADFRRLGGAAQAHAAGANVAFGVAAASAVTAGLLWWLLPEPAAPPAQSR